jgi:AraC-like DNA-binding protein
MDSLEMRILEYARQHLAEPDLTAERIAAATHVSVRYLYKVLARNEIGLADWIRSRRLEACRNALATEPRSITISAIARRNGFYNVSSFSRTFHRAFGMTPSEWRGLRGA